MVKTKVALFRSSLGAVSLALVLATLQILFDVPVAPFLVPSGARGVSAGELTAAYEDGVQRVTAKLNIVAYPSIIVQRDIPVEFTLSAAPDSIDECNEWILFPDYGIERRLALGDNVLRFTPEESGVFQIVCAQGRMKSSITVVESLGFPVNNAALAASASLEPVAVSALPELADASASSELAAAPALLEPVAASASSEPADTSALTEPADASIPEAPPQTVLYRRRAAPPTQPTTEAAPVFEKPEENNLSIGGWLEKQLTPQSGLEGVHEIRAWTGWVFDRDCVGITPVRHTKACNLMGSCYDSGLGIFEYVPGKAYDTYTALETFLCFDGASKELAAAFLGALPADWKNNVTVTVKGYAVNNIPASADEDLIPETNLSRVDHYLNGIHVTSIEAAFIDGISTYELPVPNVVFTQP